MIGRNVGAAGRPEIIWMVFGMAVELYTDGSDQGRDEDDVDENVLGVHVPERCHRWTCCLI